MKVIPNVEALAEAIITLSRPVAMDVTELYDALPDAPPPADVAAAVAMIAATHTRWANFCEKCGREWPCETNTILRALTASVADVQRLREALESAMATYHHQVHTPDDVIPGPDARHHFETCEAFNCKKWRAALAATPATGLVVVDGDVKEATDGR